MYPKYVPVLLSERDYREHVALQLRIVSLTLLQDLVVRPYVRELEAHTRSWRPSPCLATSAAKGVDSRCPDLARGGRWRYRSRNLEG